MHECIWGDKTTCDLCIIGRDICNAYVDIEIAINTDVSDNFYFLKVHSVTDYSVGMGVTHT